MITIRRLTRSSAPATTILIRILVGAVFFSEGIQKFLFSDALGVGRFAKIGIDAIRSRKRREKGRCAENKSADATGTN